MDASAFEFFAVAATTLFVVIDPLGVAPVFATLTEGQNRLKVAFKACLYSFVILSAFIFIGEELLTAVGITMPAFRAAGGILLFLIGLEMIFELRQRRRSKQAERGQEEAEEHGDHHDDVAVFPLAMPLLAGPGSITSVVLLASEGGLPVSLLTLGAVAAVLVVSILILAGGAHLLALAGRTVTLALSRLLGVLVCALSVQYVFDGVRDAIAAGAG